MIFDQETDKRYAYLEWEKEWKPGKHLWGVGFWSNAEFDAFVQVSLEISGQAMDNVVFVHAELQRPEPPVVYRFF